MIVLYVLAIVYFIFLIAFILTLLFTKKAASVQRSQTEEIIVNSNTTHSVIESVTSRPSYKKHNLTIEIPDTQGHVEDTEAQFIKKYFKVI